MSELYAQFGAVQEELLPKKKFSFKDRPRKTGAPKPTVNPSLALGGGVAGRVPVAVAPGDGDQNTTKLSGRKNEVIEPSVSWPSGLTWVVLWLVTGTAAAGRLPPGVTDIRPYVRKRKAKLSQGTEHS